MIPRHLLIAVGVMLVVALGMGAFIWRMRGRDARIQPTTAATSRPVAPPVTGPTEQVTLYVAFDNPGVLRSTAARIPLPSDRQQRGTEILRALLSVYEDKYTPHALGAGAEVRDIYLLQPGLAVVDLNGAFADGHRSGVLVEELTMASLVETLSVNLPGVARVKFLVDGKERDTLAGHADLSSAYDVSAVHQLVQQLQQSH
jgi:hypothetical protein